MSDTIDYAEMLEIPVSTLNVTQKRSKKKKTEEAELKDRVVESVNERLEAEPEDRMTGSENVTDYGDAEDYGADRGVPRKKFFDSKLLIAEFVAAALLCATILFTNIFWQGSAINTFFRGLIEGKPAAAAPDDRSYSELTLGSFVSDGDIVCTVAAETGVLTFSGTCSVYAPYGGTVKNVSEKDGKFTMEIVHTTSFSTVISGLSSAYLAAGDTVYATIPVGYVNGSEVSVSMFDGASPIRTYGVNENGDIVWNV